MICTNCGKIYYEFYKNNYIDFYENMYKIRKKSIYKRKYHIENVLNNIYQSKTNYQYQEL